MRTLAANRTRTTMSDKEAQPPANKDLARKPRGFPDKRKG
jgi:hypothetical protein